MDERVQKLMELAEMTVLIRGGLLSVRLRLGKPVVAAMRGSTHPPGCVHTSELVVKK